MYHFFDYDQGVEIFFEKEGATEKGSTDFETGHWGTSAHLYWLGFEKNHKWGSIKFFAIIRTKL